MISERMNKALGRFMDLMMLNLGGYYVKENRMGTFGYLTPFAFSEDEEACLRIGWTPYHVSQGYRLNDNTVTAASALAWGNNVTPATDDPEQIMQLLAFDITEKQQNGLGNTNPQVYRTVLMTEPVARDLAAKYSAKAMLEDDLVATARRPLFMRAYASYWANTGSVQSSRYSFEEYYRKLQQDPQEQAAMTDTPDWMSGITEQTQIETIAAMQKGQTAFLLCGDAARNKFMVLPGGGCVTIEIRLPEGWDDLVAPMGYEPLDHFLLEEQNVPGAAAPVQRAGKTEPVGPDTQSSGITAPEELTDGEYRIVPSAEQMNSEGRILRTGTGAASVWAYGSPASKTIPNEERFTGLMAALYPGCSVRIQNGRVTGIILRPYSSGQKKGGSATGLTSDLLRGLDVTIGTVQRQSRLEGKATEDGSALTFSVHLARFTVSMGKEPVLDRESTRGFISLNGSQATLNPKSNEGSAAKIGVQNADGSWSTLTFVKVDNRRITVEYHAHDTMNP